MHFKRVIIVCVIFVMFLTLGMIFYSKVSINELTLITKPTLWVGPPLMEEENSYLDDDHLQVIQDYFSNRKSINVSRLGEYLFGNSELPSARPKKTFKILVWKDGTFLEKRHLRYFSKTSDDYSHEPFDASKCSVSNCKLTYKEEDLKDADAVLFLLHRLQVKDLPKESSRPPHQRWVFVSDESPRHTFLKGSNANNWTNYTGIFNWSMTFKMKSDVPVPYGRTVALRDEREIPGKVGCRVGSSIMSLVPNSEQKQRNVLVAAMISNCGKNNRRLDYIKELGKYMTIDMYGGCGKEFKKACPGHFGTDCPLLDKYLFFLSFENTNCNEYFTEKLWWNAYSKGAVPVILGPNSNCSRLLLPPDSFINTWDFARPADLARYLIFVNQTWDGEFFKYHNWRRHFEVRNEHGYFGATSVHYCRLCEALNYNDEKPKVYDDLSDYLDPQKNCYNTFDWEKDTEKQL